MRVSSRYSRRRLGEEWKGFPGGIDKRGGAWKVEWKGESSGAGREVSWDIVPTKTQSNVCWKQIKGW